jgi:hypothetical protein
VPYTPPHETLAAAASRPISEALAAHVVLAHPHAAFHPCMCELRVGAAALIGYDDCGGSYWDDHEEETIVIDYFFYTDVRLCWIVTSTLLLVLNASSGNDDL